VVRFADFFSVVEFAFLQGVFEKRGVLVMVFVWLERGD
jgi:hypothetical protein